jgi:predicted permease
LAGFSNPKLAKDKAMFKRKPKRDGGDFNAEVEAHIAIEVDRLKEQGMNDEEARMVARRAFGNVTQARERFYESNRWRWWDELHQDARYGLRQLRRNPGFTLVAVLTLALGIGANTALFSFADAILLRPLPVVQPSRVLRISNATPENPVAGVSYPDYRDLRAESRTFSGMVAYRLTDLGVGVRAGAPPHMRLAMMASNNFFRALGITPASGRFFLPSEGKVPGRDLIAVLGYRFWNTAYGRNRSVIGRTLRINGIDFTIVGVAPESFPGLDRFFDPSIFVPLSMWSRLEGGQKDPLEDRSLHELTVLGRLRPGASRATAQAELARLGQNLERKYPAANANRRVVAETELESTAEKVPERLALVTMLMALAGLVLVIACANVASLLLARAGSRSREIAVRLAVGAGRVRLVRQLMTESLTLGLLGAVAGLGLGYGGIRFLDTMRISTDTSFNLGLQLDVRVLLFTLGAALVSCLFFGLVPALQNTGIQLTATLKAGRRMSSTPRRAVARKALVVAQIGLALVLLMVTGALVNSFRRMLTIDPGFQPAHLISMRLDPSAVRYSPQRTRHFYRELVDRARTLPGVRDVTLSQSVQLSPAQFSPDQSSVSVIPEGYQLPKGVDSLDVLGSAVDENYFDTMHIAIVRGRAFSAQDTARSQRVAIVNQQFAKTYWPNRDPLGQRLRLGGPGGPVVEVVGVTRTGRYLLPWENPTSYVYQPYEQNQHSQMNLIVESRGNPAMLVAPLRNLVRTLEPDMPISNLAPVSTIISWALNNWIIIVEVVGSMGLVGLLLAVVGLYGVISYAVGRRTSEIGVRMAIGARPADVLKLILRQGLVLAITGIVIGGILTALVVPAIASALAGVASLNALTCLAVALVLLAVCGMASYLPARRAARIDPLQALRYE